jgi:hypothetical protein
MDTHMHADFAEVLCLVNPDHDISSSDILDRFAERRDLGEEFEEADIDPELAFGVAGNYELPTEQPVDGECEEIDQISEQLVLRQRLLGSAYPFRLTVTGSSFRLARKQKLHKVHLLYLFLLIASDLTRINNPTYSRRFTSAFERLAGEMMRRLLPSGAQVHLFGTAAQKGELFHGGRLGDRMELLAKHLRGVSKLDRNHSGSSGDAGIDIVGWVPMGDAGDGLLVLMGGATCSYKNWENKVYSTSYGRLKEKVQIRVPSVNVTFIPFFMRTSSGDWHRADELGEALLVDRLRLIKGLAKAGDVIESIGVKRELRDILQIRETTV